MKIPKLTQEQRFYIYQFLQREFFKKAGKCLVMEERKMMEDKECAMGIYEFICNKFVMMEDRLLI